MAMKNPPHPGYGIKENCLLPLGLNVTKEYRRLFFRQSIKWSDASAGVDHFGVSR